jgi:hypothetical protein
VFFRLGTRLAEPIALPDGAARHFPCGLRRQMQSLSRGGHVALWLHADAIPK